MADADESPERLLNAANDASVRARTGWLTYLGLGTYLAVVIAGTRHSDLLLDSPAQLPLLGVSVPLDLFYIVAPLLLVSLHLSVLLQLCVASAKLQAWRDTETSAAEGGRERRGLLDPFVFAQVVGGAKADGFVRALMWLVIGATLLVAPVLLLLGFQIRYLPWHSQPVTWWLRVLLLADLGLLWALWPRVLAPSASWRAAFRGWRQEWVPAVIVDAMAVLSVAAALFAVFIATVPGGLVERCLWIPLPRCLTESPDHWSGQPLGITAWLFDGEPNEVKGTTTSWLSRNLVLPNQVFTHWDADRKRWVGPRLRGRDLRHATFSRSDLRGADLTGSDLLDADLHGAMLTDAKLGCASTGTAGETTFTLAAQQTLTGKCANLAGADLVHAQLTGADLRHATLTGADLTAAVLVDADLRDATLTDANLKHARLTGARLSRARLTGASLTSADLTAANLELARLTGADLTFANLTAANLQVATLTAADLGSATLTGADLRLARVHGAAPVYLQQSGTMLVDTRNLDLANPDDATDFSVIGAVRAEVQGLPDADAIVGRVAQGLAAAATNDPVWLQAARSGWTVAQRDALTQRLIGWVCAGPEALPRVANLIARARLEALFPVFQPANHDPAAFAGGVLACSQAIGLSLDDIAALKRLEAGKR